MSKPDRAALLAALRSNLSRENGDESADSAAAMLLAANPTLVEVAAERAFQDAKWGGKAHDDEHSLADWARFIGKRLEEVRGLDRTYDVELRRPTLRLLYLECAALAVAGMEAIDRRDGAAVREAGDKLRLLVNQHPANVVAALQQDPALRSKLNAIIFQVGPEPEKAAPQVEAGPGPGRLPSLADRDGFHLLLSGRFTVCGLDPKVVPNTNRLGGVTCQRCKAAVVASPIVHVNDPNAIQAKPWCGSDLSSNHALSTDVPFPVNCPKCVELDRAKKSASAQKPVHASAAEDGNKTACGQPWQPDMRITGLGTSVTCSACLAVQPKS